MHTGWIRWLATALAVGVVAAAGPALARLEPAAGSEEGWPQARNVILINGDGMGAAQREAARLYYTGLDGILGMDRLPVAGELTTTPHDASSVITDSAAAASAWSTGVRTFNGAISVDVGRNPLPILGAQAKAAGRSTGLVTSAQVTDASPAAMFASVPDRNAQDVIARQYLEVSKPDVILGGGEDWWLPAGTPGAYPDQPTGASDEGSRGTQGDLVAAALQGGYQYVSTADQLHAARGSKLLGLFGNEELFQQHPEGQGDVYDPPVSLADMTTKALETLGTNRKGFFLFVEEEAIDEFAHQGNGPRMLQAIGELEKAVAVARAYVAHHPDTLLVVTGDHETGGLTVRGAGPNYQHGSVANESGPFPAGTSGMVFVLNWSTNGHTGVSVPLSAEGARAERFAGVHPNTYVHDVLAPILTR